MCAHHTETTCHAVANHSRLDFGTVSSVLSALDAVTGARVPRMSRAAYVASLPRHDDLAQSGPAFDELSAWLRDGLEAS